MGCLLPSSRLHDYSQNCCPSSASIIFTWQHHDEVSTGNLPFIREIPIWWQWVLELTRCRANLSLSDFSGTKLNNNAYSEKLMWHDAAV